MEEKKANVEIEESTRKPGLYNNFMWWCAGVNRDVLRQCPTEWAKYAGMGGTIFSTACMATLSGGYAISTVFDNTIVAVLFGLFWGFVIIFNMDRLIVNTMYSDGKETISLKELGSGSPRILIAIFLGLVISAPLELRIYESEINVKIGEKIKEKKDQYISRDKNRIDSLTNVISEIRDKAENIPIGIALSGQAQQIQSSLLEEQARLNNIRSKIKDLQHQRSTIEPNSDSYSNISKRLHDKYIERDKQNAIVRRLQGDLGRISNEYSDAIKKSEVQKDELIKTIQLQIAGAQSAMSDSTSYNKLIDEEYGGFEARMAAFNEMREENPSTNRSAWCITLLFIIIEIVPTIMRMMVADGSYEKLLEAETHRFKVLADKRISDLNDLVNTEVQISTKKNRQRLEAEVLANKELIEKVAKVQAELLQTAIDKWREEELAKIEKDPSAYIKTNNV